MWRMYWKEPKRREGGGQKAFAGSQCGGGSCDLVHSDAELEAEADRLEA